MFSSFNSLKFSFFDFRDPLSPWFYSILYFHSQGYFLIISVFPTTLIVSFYFTHSHWVMTSNPININTTYGRFYFLSRMLPIFSIVPSWQSIHPGPFDGGLGHLICLGQWDISIGQFARCTLKPQETPWAFTSPSCIFVIHHENIPWETFSPRIRRHMKQYWDELQPEDKGNLIQPSHT